MHKTVLLHASSWTLEQKTQLKSKSSTPSLLILFLDSEIVVPGSGKSIEKLDEQLRLNVVLKV